GVLTMEADRHRHVRARREVERVIADPVHRRRDREHVGSRQPGRAPQALVAVARGRVDELDRAHFGSTRNSGCPYSTSAALSQHTSAIVPAMPAGTEFIIFITSMMATIVSRSTSVPTSTNGSAPGRSAR